MKMAGMKRESMPAVTHKSAPPIHNYYSIIGNEKQAYRKAFWACIAYYHSDNKARYAKRSRYGYGGVKRCQWERGINALQLKGRIAMLFRGTDEWAN